MRIGVIGLAFKTGTDDLRESPSILLIKPLWRLGYKVSFYDPSVSNKQVLALDH
ncbi:UDP binding domain-containing protein [Psychromonas hadalis]|uniref:UDP binding domain-containing protein n=1 Tax=Psychromonas hadalis TaxID=211669 RepID=UPI0003B2E552